MHGPYIVADQGWLYLPLVPPDRTKCRNLPVQILGWFGVLQEDGGSADPSESQKASWLIFSPVILDEQIRLVFGRMRKGCSGSSWAFGFFRFLIPKITKEGERSSWHGSLWACGSTGQSSTLCSGS